MKVMLDNVFDKTMPGLEKALDLTYRRNEAISSNIANAETPQYRAMDLNFAGELEQAFNQSSSQILRTDARHMDTESTAGAYLAPDLSGATKPDGNNVDIDIQMGQLAYNSGKFTSATRLLRKKLGLIKFAIREGGR